MKFRTKDTDVIAFIKAAGITGGTEFNAVNYLVLALKNNNLWNRIYALYPFVGGTATTHKFNLKNPLNTNGAFRLTFTGGVTHDANGVTFDGVNGYANTFLTPSTTITFNNESFFLYARNQRAAGTGIDLGSAVSITQRSELIIRSGVDNYVINLNSTTSGAGNVTVGANTGTTGFFMGSRQTSTDLRAYKNGTQVGTTASVVNNGNASNLDIYFGARHVAAGASNFTNANYGLVGIGNGFTVAECSTWNTIVQEFQRMLNRQV